MTGEKRPFAVFDIDGTLIRWQLYHAVGDKLAKHGHISEAAFARVRAARMEWKRREHEASFVEYERALVVAFLDAIRNIPKAAMDEAIQEVFDEYKDQTYTYTRSLIAELKAKNYLLFAISGSQTEIIEPLARYYGFDDFGGSNYEYADGKYTGEVFVLRRDEKPKYLAKLVDTHDATYTDSIGVGDSESDIPILEAIEKPIAMNPDKALFEHAKEQGWKIVIERKNMVYELESRDGQYVLA